MKKNFSVNIGGRIFNIDDDAYERLNSYLARLRNFFSVDEGHEEIMADIEMRIAELLEQKKQQGLAIVALEQIEEVIASMGEPDQLSDNEANSAKEASRIKTSGKLFRDPEHRQIGGVAAGIAAWFGIDALWVRIAFGILLFFYGIGVILYIILWLILPVARTTTERLEMQRQTINIGTLRNEVASVGSGLKNTGSTVLHSTGKFMRFLTELAGHLFRLLLKVLRLASGAFFLFFALSLFVGLGLAYIIREPFNGHMYSLDNITQADAFAWFVPGAAVQWLAYIAIALFVIGISGMLVFLGLRLMLKWPPIRWQVLLVFGLLIAAGLIVAGGAMYQYSHSIAEKANISGNTSYPLNKKKYIHLSAFPDDTHLYWSPLSGAELTKRNRNVLGRISLSIRPAPSDSIIITTIRGAAGITESMAAGYLQSMAYEYSFQDTLLVVNPFFTFPKSDGMHYQTTDLIIGIPVKTTVLIDEHLDWRVNFREMDQDVREGGEFIMTSSGLKLKNPPKPVSDTIQ